MPIYLFHFMTLQSRDFKDRGPLFRYLAAEPEIGCSIPQRCFLDRGWTWRPRGSLDLKRACLKGTKDAQKMQINGTFTSFAEKSTAVELDAHKKQQQEVGLEPLHLYLSHTSGITTC